MPNDLPDMLDEVMQFCHDLQLFNKKREDNIHSIVQMEKQNLEEFRKLHGSIGNRATAWSTLSAIGGGAAGAGAGTAAANAAGLAAGGPVVLVAAALLGVAGGIYLSAGHRDAAKRVQQSLMEDMQAKNVPIQ